jgi:hypothetical protein
MIDNALKFVVHEVNKYVVRKIDPTDDPSVNNSIVLGNIAKAFDTDGGNPSNPPGKAMLTLVNVEEDRISKLPVNFIKAGDKIQYKNPKLFLNLYCLFSVHHSSYDVALQYLSLIMQFFQHKNIINHHNSPSASGPQLDNRVEQLVFDMVTMNFEQINHLWGTMGGKYFPSVLYKMRLVIIEDETPERIAPPIVGLGINE